MISTVEKDVRKSEKERERKLGGGRERECVCCLSAYYSYLADYSLCTHTNGTVSEP